MKQIKKCRKSAIVIILSMVLTLSACTNPINVSGGTGDKDGDANAHANIVSTTSATDDSWKGIYANFLENEMTDILGDYVSEEYDTWTFGFIFVNDDNIPELVISSGYEAGGNIILTIANGEVDFFYTRRLGFYYDERGNVLINADGHMGVYFDYVFNIQFCFTKK